MREPVYNVLFLCTGNSARSIMAEAILNHLGKGRFRAYSAGSHPRGEVHPLTLAQMKKLDFPESQFHSKSWDTFLGPKAPEMDFVFTLCDKAGREACVMAWPGDPITAHWGVPDPAEVEGSDEEKAHAFQVTFLQIQNRIGLFLALPIGSIDRMSLHHRLIEIGQNLSHAPIR